MGVGVLSPCRIVEKQKETKEEEGEKKGREREGGK